MKTASLVDEEKEEGERGEQGKRKEVEKVMREESKQTTNKLR